MSENYSICENCGTEFDFIEDEQTFYKETVSDNDPAQCPMCKRGHLKGNQSQSWY